ncbi:MAG: PepSY domain-containing protein [Nitrosomonas sp.]|nr:PepSY domain-containing protein [Nitrosomonas sp.]
MAGFLIVVSLTGSLLAFYPELERLINPQFYSRQTTGDKLDLATLAERAEQQAPGIRVESVTLEANQGATLIGVSPRVPGSDPGFNNLFMDPYTGSILDKRQFGAISDGWINFMSFVYQLHYALALGKFGIWVLGICALIWTIDCFVGFYLSLPQHRKSAPSVNTATGTAKIPDWWRCWKPAWKIRWQSSKYKLNFDLHRASGLWLWPVLFIFAWSSVYMNLWDTIYTWTTRAVFDYKAPWTELPRLDGVSQEPRLNWRQAQAAGRYWMERQARLYHFEVYRPVALRLDRERNVYQYTVRSSRDIQDRRGTTRVFFGADTGAFKLLLLPSGQYDGNTVTSWLYALHMGNVLGLPWRIFVCIIGLIIVMLSVTGIIIWSKKRYVQKSKNVTWEYLRTQKLAALRSALDSHRK